MALPNSKDPITILGNDKLSDRVKSFQASVEKKQIKPKTSASFDFDSRNKGASGSSASETTSTGLSKDDPRYGRPPEGSLTEYRGLKAHSQVSAEVQQLLRLIREYGEEQRDGSYEITFGELFQMYTVISNKVVGILLRARKHGLLDFQGEMLYQRRDEGKIITVFPPPLYG